MGPRPPSITETLGQIWREKEHYRRYDLHIPATPAARINASF